MSSEVLVCCRLVHCRFVTIKMTSCLAVAFKNSNIPYPHSNILDGLYLLIPARLILIQIKHPDIMQDEHAQAYADHNEMPSPDNDMANGMVEEDPQLPVQSESGPSVVNTVFLVLVAGVQNAFNSSIEQLASDTDQVCLCF